MDVAFFLIIVAFLFFSSIKWPGITLAYLFFFQILNNGIFDLVGLQSFKYATFVFFAPLVFYKTYSKDKFRSFKKLLFTSSISKAYFFLLFYITLYAFSISTSYEINYLIKFIFPGTIFFVLALYFFNEIKIYKEVVFGVILFSFVTLGYLYLFKGLASIINVARLSISQEIGMGPIVQGRMAGMLCLTTIIMFFNSRKVIHKSSFMLMFIPAFLWLSVAGSRGPLLALLIVVVVYSFLKKRTIALSTSFIILSVMFTPIFLKYGVFDLALFERLNEVSSTNDITSMERYRRYLIFLSLPIEDLILGLGPGGWGKEIALLSKSDYRFPHNVVLESIAEHGFVGAIFIFTVILTGFRQLIKNIKNNTSNLYMNILLLWWFYYFLNTLVSGGYIQGNINFFTLTSILACINIKRHINAK